MSSAQPMRVKKTLFSEALIQDPYRIYQQFLEEGPIHYIERGAAPGLWAVFSYAHCAALLKDSRVTAKRSGATLLAFPPERRAEFAPLAHQLGLWMLFLDAPEHSRLRKLMNKGFGPAGAESLRTTVEGVVDEMLEPLRHASEAELMKQIAHPLPVRVIAAMLGISGAMQEQLTEWSDAIATFLGNPRRTIDETSAAQNAVLALVDYFKDVVAERRRSKGNDLISLLLEIEEDGDVLTEEELYAQCVMLLFGGHETTRNLIGNGMLTLLQHPQEATRLRDQPALIRSGVEELLRYESPVQGTTRIVKEEMELCGETMTPGTIIFPILGSANRDSRQFKDPETLDLARLNNTHLAFGAGAHHCIGNQIARLEAQVAILRLVEGFPAMKLANAVPQWSPNYTLRGLTSLAVSLM
jgi:cytochrome P450